MVEPEETPKDPRGGPRPGAGRKPGRKAVTRSITLPVEIWEEIDQRRAGKTRSKVIHAAIIDNWKCQKCNKNPMCDLHGCSYQADINDDEDFSCNCCEECQHECEMDI